MRSKSELLNRVWDFEDGSLTGQAMVEWFGDLINTGLIWQLPTYYLDNGAKLIEKGYLGHGPRQGGGH